MKPFSYTDAETTKIYTKTTKIYKTDSQNPFHIQLKPLKSTKKGIMWLKPITYTN